MATKQRGLGKGLDALFGDSIRVQEEVKEKKPEANASGGEVYIRTALIIPKSSQPRKNFEKDKLQELAESIKKYGVLQPLLVIKKDNGYQIIAGERRWRAAQMAGLTEVPCLVRDYDELLQAEVSIIENLHRENLNPIEEAKAYEQLMEEFDFSQEEVAEKVSKSRSAITNMLRLLKLDEDVQMMLIDGRLSAGHARALLAIEDKQQQKNLAEKCVREKLSVREVERLAKKSSRPKKEVTKKADEKDDGRDYSIFYEEYENKMKDILGTKVHINRKDNSKGRIEIEYYSQPELERIMELLNSIGE